MKLCIFSDSHGKKELVAKLYESVQADAYLFCGDGLGDIHCIPEKVYAVAGNCDWGSDLPDVQVLELGGRRILLTHGHRYRVKSDLYRLSLAAREEQAEVAVFGHTHIPARVQEEGLLMLNPGALSGRPHTCLVLDTDTLEASWVEIP